MNALEKTNATINLVMVAWAVPLVAWAGLTERWALWAFVMGVACGSLLELAVLGRIRSRVVEGSP